MKVFFKKFPIGALVAGVVPAVIDDIMILSFDKILDPWMLLQATLFWFACGFIVYKLNQKREILVAVFYTVLLNLPWFIVLSFSNGKTSHFLPLLVASIAMGILIGYITKWLPNKGEFTIEWAPFEVLENVSEKDLIEASTQLQLQFLNHQNGFIKRELLHLESKKWVDLVYWENMETAARAMEHVMNSEICQNYFKLMKPIAEGSDPGVVHLTKKYEYLKPNFLFR